MITEMFQCPQAFRNFTSSCIPIDTSGNFNIDLITSNITNGLCPDSLYNIVNNCIPSPFFYMYGQKDTPCYSSAKDFLSCLPANAANLTGWPKTCSLLSWAVFLSNEAITFLEDVNKLLAFATTQALRRLETINCLPSCSKYDFKYLGPKEFRKEISRYAEGFGNTAILPFGIGAHLITVTNGVIGPVPAAYVGYEIGNAHNVVSQLFQAVPNQGARNEDFLETKANCTLSEHSLNIEDLSALLPSVRPSSLFKSSSPNFSILSISQKTAVVAFDVLSFILTNAYSGSVYLLSPPLNALYNSAPYGAKLCGRAVYSLGETLFNGGAYIAKSCLNSSLFSQKIKSPLKKLPIKIGREFKKTTFPYKELQEGDLHDFIKVYPSDDKGKRTPINHIVDKKFNQECVSNATSTANYLMGLFACIGSGSC